MENTNKNMAAPDRETTETATTEGQSLNDIMSIPINPAFKGSDLDFFMEMRDNIQATIDRYAERNVYVYDERLLIVLMANDCIKQVGGYSEFLEVISADKEWNGLLKY